MLIQRPTPFQFFLQNVHNGQTFFLRTAQKLVDKVFLVVIDRGILPHSITQNHYVIDQINIF